MQKAVTAKPFPTTVAIAAGLVVLTVLAYWGLWRNQFINFDDTQYITENVHVKTGLALKNIKWAFTEFHASNWHPLTWISHMLDVSLFGMWAGGHHITNLVFHILNTLLVFGFLRCTTKRLWASAFVAGLFALHPLHVESVAWVAERKDVLSTFFWLSTMWSYVFYVRKPGALRYSGVVVLFAMGLMAKPMLVTLPVVLLLVDYWPLERIELERKGRRLKFKGASLKRLVCEKLPLLAIAVCSAVITVKGQQAAMTKLDSADLAPRLTNAVISYGRYILKMVWPTDLAGFYPYSIDAQYGWALAVLVLLVAATATFIYLGGRLKYLPAGWLWYIITLVPVVGIVRVGSQSHADRYTYVPLIGIFIIITWGAAEIIEKKPQLKRFFLVCGVIILVSAGAMTNWTCRLWKDTYTFALRAATVTHSFKMLLVLATSQMDRGELDLALANLREASKLDPNDPELLSGLGQVMLKMDRYAEAAQYCKAAIRAYPSRCEDWLNAGLALYGLGQVKEAEEHLRKAMEFDPQWAPAYSQMGRILAETGRIDEAIATYKQAIKLDPMLQECHFNIAVLYMRQGDFQSAAVELRKKIAIEADYDAWSNLGGCMVAMKRLEDAEKAYMEAIKLAPGNAMGYYNLGVVMASMGRTDEAIRQVRKAIELDPSDQSKRNYYRELTGDGP
jgi:tetratricopeptide (TPR) repeat protein